jgi:hypothetical protein
MTTIKGMNTMSELTQTIAKAIETASKAGLSRDRILQVLDLVKETTEESDVGIRIVSERGEIKWTKPGF